MNTGVLSAATREAALKRLADPEPLDVLVVGGGITGAGIALDAAARGLTTAIVESQDWSAGTSSRSSKLVHGGLRYLQMLDFRLVYEALHERDLLLSTIAPHLVRSQPFLYPLKHHVWERAYVACGVGLYDALAQVGAKHRAMPIQKHLSRRGTQEMFPSLRDDAAVGAIRYYDAQADDARLTLTIIRTAVAHGAFAASRAQLVRVTTGEDGAVDGAIVKDLLTGEEVTVRTKRVIVATGVWTEQTESLAGAEGGLRVLASKGIHIVVPREAIQGKAGLISQTEKSVLFVIPWDRYWIIGTTDTPWTEELEHPVATARDIDYLLEHANALLRDPITRDDIIGTYAGLRPLLQPGTKEGTDSAKVSREHTVASPTPGLTTIAGGKLTTYRVMAKDAVDFALGSAAARPSVTATLPLVGAEGFDATMSSRKDLAFQYVWNGKRLRHLLGRYGSLITELTALIDADPSLGSPLASAPEYLKAEVAYAVTAEGALSVEDVLRHRVRLDYEKRDRGASAAAEVAKIMAPLLGWSASERRAQVDSYLARCEAIAAAEKTADDASAATARLGAPDLVPLA